MCEILLALYGNFCLSNRCKICKNQNFCFGVISNTGAQMFVSP